MHQLVARSEVTEKQALLVDHLVRGCSVAEAAERAGYSSRSSADAALRSKTVALLLNQRMTMRLASGAPTMFSVLEQVATNRAAPAGARVDAAKAWLDRAGWTVPRVEGKSISDGKGLAEMSADELRQTVRDLKAMKDVTPVTNAEGLDDPDGLFT